MTHDQDKIHAEMDWAETCNFRMAALMFLTGHVRKAGTHTHAEVAYFPTQCIISTWKAFGFWPHAFQALMMHLLGKCAIFTFAWVLAI